MQERPPRDIPQAAPVDAVAPAHAVRCLKAAGARSVWLVSRPGEGARTVKGWPRDPLMVLKWAMGRSQPQRHVRAASRLAAAGISTPRVLGGPTWTRRGGRTLLELELEFVEGRTALEVMRDDDAVAIERAASAVATLLRRLIESRLFNRDLKLSNVLIAEGAPGAQAWLLDPVAVRRMSDVRAQSARMLERLAVEPRERGMPIPRQARREVVAAALAAIAEVSGGSGQPRQRR